MKTGVTDILDHSEFMVSAGDAKKKKPWMVVEILQKVIYVP